MTTFGQVTIQVSPTGSIAPARDLVIEFPAGQFVFKSPLPNLPTCVIRGASKIGTSFVKRFHGGTFFKSDGTLNNGLIIERLNVLADPRYRPGYFCYLAGRAALTITGASGPTDGFASITTNGSHGIAVGGSFTISGCTPSAWNGNYVATSGSGANQLNFALAGTPGGLTVLGQVDSVFQPDNFQLKDLYISQSGAITPSSPPGGGFWQHGILIDGSSRSYPQGIRIGLIENCEIFNCMYSGVYIKNGVGITMRGGGLFPAAAAAQYPQGTGVYVAGGVNDPLHESTTCHFQGVINNCQLNISKSSYCTWMGGSIGGLATDDSHHWRIDTLNAGAIANNLVDSSVSLVPPP